MLSVLLIPKIISFTSQVFYMAHTFNFTGCSPCCNYCLFVYYIRFNSLFFGIFFLMHKRRPIILLKDIPSYILLQNFYTKTSGYTISCTTINRESERAHDLQKNRHSYKEMCEYYTCIHLWKTKTKFCLYILSMINKLVANQIMVFWIVS